MRAKILMLVLAAALLVAWPALAVAGTIVAGQCECGFKTGTMPLGGGMANFRTVANFPAYCPSSNKFLLVNVLQKPLGRGYCPGGVVLYDQPKMIGQKGRKTVFSWNLGKKFDRVLVLTDGTYFCPRCHRFKLRFRHVGMWD